jgi:hypothetical protein
MDLNDLLAEYVRIAKAKKEVYTKAIQKSKSTGI